MGRRAGLWGTLLLVAACSGDDASAEGGSTGETDAGASSGTTGAATTTSGPGSDGTSTGSASPSTGAASTDGTGSGSTTGASVTIDDPIRIIYVSDDAIADLEELWLVDEANYGDGPIRLNHELVGPRLISPSTPLSADGTWLCYRAVRLAPGAEHQLYVVDVSGVVPGAPVRVDETAELVFDYAFSSDGGHLAWMTANGVFASAMSPAGPGPVVTLAPPPTGAGIYNVFELSPVDDTIFYTADPDGIGALNLYQVPADDSADPELLSDLVAAGSEVDGNRILPDPLGEYVVYQADRDVAEPELFWADLAPVSAPVKIHSDLTTESMRTERLSPTGTDVAYWVGTLGDPDVGDVFTVPLSADGPGVPLAVHGAQPGEPQAGNIAWSPDGTWLAYAASDGGVQQSWIVPVTAGVPGMPTRVSGLVPADGNDLVTHVFSPDSDAIAYIADTAAGPDLFYVELSAGVGPIQRIIDPPPAGGGLTGDLKFSADGTQLLFTGFVLTVENRELFRVDLSAGPPWTLERVNPDFFPNQDVGVTPQFAGGDTHVLFAGPVSAEGGRVLYDHPPGGVGFDVAVPISNGEGYVISFSELPPPQ